MTGPGTVELETTLSDRFERVAAAYPDQLALTQGDEQWRYSDLWAASGCYAQALAALKPGDTVALVFGQTAEAIIALMGALRAGVQCLPVDPAAPPLGLSEILAGCEMVLAQDDRAAWCRQTCGGTTVLSHSEAMAGPASGAGPLAPRTARPEDTCLIYFTSGSSGVAKGVQRTHLQTMHGMKFLIEKRKYGPGDRLAMFASFAFSGSIPVIFGALLSGAAIDVIDLRDRNTSDFARYIPERGITVLAMTASLLRVLTDGLAGSGSRWQPRLVSLAGEAAYTRDVLAMRTALGWNCPVYYGLASSEVGVVAEWVVDLDICDPEALLPTGYPIRGKQVVIVDDAGAALPVGQIGEIVVEGRVMARGYWKRPDLTDERFVDISTPEQPGRQRYNTGDLGQLTDTGLLEFMGRKGGMLKVRGYSVDTSAVEAEMRTLDGVVNAIALARPGAQGNDYLAAFVQGARQAPATAREVRLHLYRTLPEYMVPKRVVVLDDLPLTAGGKIDRRRLPAVGRDRPGGMAPGVPPVGAAEKLLARLWAEVLEIDEIGREDDFFEMGGDSLDALTLAMGLQQELGLEMDEASLFFVTDLAGMAKLIEHRFADLSG